jgi:hypothetical protein
VSQLRCSVLPAQARRSRGGAPGWSVGVSCICVLVFGPLRLGWGLGLRCELSVSITIQGCGDVGVMLALRSCPCSWANRDPCASGWGEAPALLFSVSMGVPGSVRGDRGGEPGWRAEGTVSMGESGSARWWPAVRLPSEGVSPKFTWGHGPGRGDRGEPGAGQTLWAVTRAPSASRSIDRCSRYLPSCRPVVVCHRAR